MNTKTISGSELKVGDDLVVFGKAHRVTTLHAYPKLSEMCPGSSGRIADCADGFGMTIFDQGRVEVTA